jgi:hypothetical protein
MLALAVPTLVLPASYLWRAQRGLNAYDGLGDPALAWPSPLSYLALAAMALPYLARWARDGTPWRRSPLDAPIVLYVAAMALGLWPAVDRAHSWTAFLGILGGVGLCYGAWHWGSRNAARRLWPLVALLILAGCALAALGYLQTDWSQAQRRGAAFLAPVHSPLSTLPALGAKRLNPSVVGNTLLPLIPLAFFAAGAARHAAARLGAALAALLMLSYLVVVWSRGDLLALGATALLALLWQWRGLREAALGLGVGAVGALAMAAVFSPGTVAPLGDLAGHIYPARAMVWTRALYIIGDHPFTGAGLDNFRPIARNSYPYFDPAFDQTEHAHSWPLQAGVDGGIWGMAAVVWLAVAFYVAAARAAKRDVRPAASAVSSAVRPGFVAGFTAFFIGLLYDNGTMSGPRAALVFWLFLGAALVTLAPHADAVDEVLYRRPPPAPRRGRIAAGIVLPVSRRVAHLGQPGLGSGPLAQQPGQRRAQSRALHHGDERWATCCAGRRRCGGLSACHCGGARSGRSAPQSGCALLAGGTAGGKRAPHQLDDRVAVATAGFLQRGAAAGGELHGGGASRAEPGALPDAGRCGGRGNYGAQNEHVEVKGVGVAMAYSRINSSTLNPSSRIMARMVPLRIGFPL